MQDEASDSFAYTAPGIQPKPGEPGSPENPISHEPDPNPFIGLGADETDGFTSDSSPESPFGINPEALDGLEETRDAQAKANEEVLSQLDTELDQNQGQRDTGRKKARRVEAEAAGREAIASIIGNARLQAGQVSISSETGMQTVSEAREQALEDRVRTELRSEQAELLLEHGDRGRGLFGTGKDEAAYAALALMQGETVEADIPASALIPELIDEELTADPSLSPEQRAQEFRENLGTSFVSTQERLRESQASLETMRAELNDPSTSLTRRQELTDQMLATRVEQEKLTMRAETLSQVHSRVTKLINAGNIDEVLKIQDDSAGALVGLNFNQDNRTEILARGLDISANPAELQAYRENLGSTIQTAQVNLDRASTVQERNRLARQFELHDQLTQALDQGDYQAALAVITDEHGNTINPLDPPQANKPAPQGIATRALSQTTVERARTQIAELESELESSRDLLITKNKTELERQAVHQRELAAIDQRIESIEARAIPSVDVGFKIPRHVPDPQAIEARDEDLIAAQKQRTELLAKRETELEEERKSRAELLSERTDSLVRIEQARELMSKGDYAAALQVINGQAEQRSEDVSLALDIEDRTGFPDRSKLRAEARAAHEHRDDVNAVLALSQEQLRVSQARLEALRDDITNPQTPEAIRAARLAQYETLSIETQAQARALDQSLQYQTRLTELVESGQYDEVIKLKNGETSFETQAKYGEGAEQLYQRASGTELRLTRREAEVEARRLHNESIAFGEELAAMETAWNKQGRASLADAKAFSEFSYFGRHVRTAALKDFNAEFDAASRFRKGHLGLQRARETARAQLAAGEYHQARETMREAMRTAVFGKEDARAELGKHYSFTAGEAEERINASFESAKNTIVSTGTAVLVMGSGGAALPLLMAGGVGMGSGYAMDLGYAYGDKKDLDKAIDYANSKIGQNAKTVGMAALSSVFGMGSSKLAGTILKSPWAKAALSRFAPKTQDLLAKGIAGYSAGTGGALPGVVEDLASRVSERVELTESLKARGYSQEAIEAELKKHKLDNESLVAISFAGLGGGGLSGAVGGANSGASRSISEALIRGSAEELVGFALAAAETSVSVDPESPEYVDALLNNAAGAALNRALGASAARDLDQSKPEIKIEIDESLDPDTPAQTRIEVDADGKERAVIAMHPSYRQRLIDADPTALQGISVDLQRAIDQSRSQRLETEPDNLSPEEASLRASETLLEEEYHLLQEARIDPIKRSWTGRRQKDPNSPNGYRTMSEAEYSSRRSLGEFEAEQYGQVKARETLLADARARGDQQAITRLESEIAETRKTYDDRRTILQDHINNGRWETAMSFAKSNGITEADLQNYRADYEHNAKADRDGLRQTSNNSSSGETAKLKADLGSFLRTPNGDSSDLVARLREIDHSELSETERAYYDRALDSLESQRLADPALAQELARLASNGNELVIQDSLERTLFAGKDQDPRFIKNYIEAELRPQIEAGYERLRTKLSDGSSRAEIEAEIRNLRDLMLPIATYNGSNLSQSAARGAEADQPVFTELEQNLRAADLDSLLRSRETDDTAFRNEARRYLNERDSQRPVLALEANNARDISKLEEYIDDYIEEYNDPTEDAEEIGAMLSTIDRESLSPEESASISAVLTRARDKGMNLPAIADDFIASDSSTIRQRSNHSNSDEVAIRASIHAGSRKIEVDPDYQASSHNERIATALLAEAEAALLDGTETSGLPTSDEIAILREDIKLGDPEAVIEFAKTHPELGPSLVDIQVTETMRRAEQRAARNNHNLTVITDDPEVITSDSLPEGVMAQTETTVHPDGTRETRIKFAAGLEEAARRGEREALEIYLEEMNRHASATLLDPSSMSEAEYTAARAFEELGAEVEAKREAAEATGGKLGAIEDGVYKEALGRLAPAISGDPATREARSQAALDAIQTEAELRIGSEPLITEPDLQNYRADYEHNSKTGETRQTSNSTVLGKKARESMLRDLEEWGSPNGPHRTDESIRKFEAAYADGIEGTDEILKGAHEAETPGKRQGFYGEAANNDTISKAMKKYGVDPSEGIRTSLRHVEGKAQLVDHLGRAIDIPKEGDAEAMQKFNQAGYTIDGRGALFYTGGGRRRPIKDGASKGGDDKKQVFVRNGRLVNGNGDPVMIVATKREYGMSHAAREIDTAVDAELRAGDKTVRLQRYFEHKLRPATLVNKVFGMPNEPRDHGDGGAQLRSLIALSHAHGSNPSIMISAETSALYADDASSFRRFGEALATTLPMYQEAKAAGIVLPKLVVYDENMKPIMQVDASGVSLPGDKK